MPSSRSADIIMAAIRAVEARDASALHALYDPEIEFRWPPGLPFSGAWRGGEIADMTERYRAALDPLQPDEASRRMVPEVIADDGEGRVAARYTLRARAPDGRRFETLTMADYRVRDGRLVQAQMFYFDLPGLTAFLASTGLGGAVAPEERRS